MTIPKKGSRSIEVNGRQYRWMVSAYGPDDDIWVKVTVEDQESGEIKQTKRKGFMGDHPAVKPEAVKEFILSAF